MVQVMGPHQRYDDHLLREQAANEYYSQVQVTRDNTNCPAFLLTLKGTHFTVGGAITVKKNIFYQEFASVNLTDPYCWENVTRVARLLFHFNESLWHLNRWYREVSFSEERLRMEFPHVQHYASATGAMVEFRYLERLAAEPRRLVFLAETADKRKIVVKFVERYSAEAHNLLATNGYAPALLFDGTKAGAERYGSHRMVVMEWVSEAEMQPGEKTAWFKEVDNAIRLLHDHNLVFGDIRSPNIITVRNGARLGVRFIDFDWAGKVGTALWPPLLNKKDIKWPPGVKSGDFVTKLHDQAMLVILRDGFAEGESHPCCNRRHLLKLRASLA